MSLAKKILIIDDEADLCLLLKQYFLRKQYNVLVSNTLNEGTRMLHDEHPDVVFLDNNLPDGLGWSVAPIVAEQFPGTYIVLVSAFHPEVPAMPAHSRYIVIEKPLSFAELDMQFAKM